MRITSRITLLGISAIALIGVVSAKSGFGEACDQANQHLDGGSYNLVTDCDATTYCASNGTCAYKGCRKDIYPFGYSGVSFDQLPPLCPSGQFCPDEGDQCLDQVAIGDSCQKDRDNECAEPSNYKDLAGFLNTNGTVCLNYTCYLADITLGQTCVTDNTVYTAYLDDGSAYAFIVSRDNCANGMYCDGTALQCIKMKRQGETCTGNKECLTYNCAADGKCGKAADDPIHPPAWQYVLIGLGIVVLIGGVMITLWFTHRSSRKENQIRLEQYYNEQIAYRQSIMSMSHAKNSLLSLPPNTSPDVARSSLYRDDSGWTTGTNDALLPPNVRSDSASGWSDGDGAPKERGLTHTDSEVLLMHTQGEHNRESRYMDAPEPRRGGRGYRG
ncbi:uncharacterized protein IL334_006828 [Kwoniella shivajii]|uniref:Uncharacterized protein n=1 Tax=Kwoniella shivajii TaxID=564305 RepID=A0ABZ1DAY7_9TREE|nr:hypothetical protein IL334_006828 [Kwoniella shivajii]